MIIFVTMLILAAFVPNSSAISADSNFYVKGMAEKYGPFSGSYIRILVDGHVGTIIVTSKSHASIKLDLSDPVRCYDEREKVCLTGLVVQTRKIGYLDVGELVRLSLDPDGKNHSISVLKGEKVGSIQYIDSESKSTAIRKVITNQRFLSLPEEKGNSVLVSSYEDSKMSDAIATARKFTMTHPTYAFDGIPESLKLNLVSVIDEKIPVYIVQVNFDSSHVGYGNRTGQFNVDKVTPHTMIVMVSDLGVGSAIIDGVWDEFNQDWQK
ncbi:MAG: hypothetical protein ACT4N5_08005 [Nitrosopumilaceae archaeon]